MRRPRFPLPALLAPLAALLLAGCASLGPVNQSSSSLGMVVGALQFQKIVIPFPNHYADHLHLAPVSPQGQLDLDHPLVSRFTREGQAYLFNVPPGRYAVTGGTYRAHGLRYSLRLKPEHVMQTVFEVRPGEVAFAGNILVRRQFQDWVVFTLNVLKSIAIVLPPWRPLATEVDAAFRSVDRSAYSEIQALAAARRHLAGTLWAGPVLARLNALGGLPPEPVTTGFWRKKPKPVLYAETFSWVDTLGWGRPWAIKGGLEWRAPKDRARIAARFLAEGEAGFQPREDYLRELKLLGSPEDTHTLTEVFLSTAMGHAIRYNKYVYPEPYLTGSVAVVFTTDVMVMPGRGGYYIVHYRARRGDFERYLKDYLSFRGRLRLAPPDKSEVEKKP